MLHRTRLLLAHATHSNTKNMSSGSSRVDVHKVVGDQGGGVQYSVHYDGKVKVVLGWDAHKVEKAVSKIAKWVRGEVAFEGIDSSEQNATVWATRPSGEAFLTVKDEKLPVRYEPCVVTSIEPVNDHCFACIPLKVDVATLGEGPLTIEWRVNDTTKQSSQDACFTPNEEDVAGSISVTVKGEEGDVLKTYSFPTVVRPLPKGLAEKYDSWAKPVPEADLRIGSYNILADMFAAGSSWGRDVLYPYVKDEFLDQNYRFQVILKDVLVLGCEVVSLQEVGNSFFRKLLSVLGGFGYDGWHLPKLGTGAEGCAIFWKKERLTPLTREAVPLGGGVSKLGFDEELLESIESHEETKKVFSMVVSVMQWMTFSDVKTGKEFAYCNTHLFFRPWGNVIRALQVYQVYQYAAKKKFQNAFVLTGDLNTVTHERILKATQPEIISGTFDLELGGTVEVKVVENGILHVGGVAVTKSLEYDMCKGSFIVDGEVEVGVGREFFNAIELVLSVTAQGTVKNGAVITVPTRISPPCAYRLISGETLHPTDADYRYTSPSPPTLALPALTLPFSLSNPNPPDLRYSIFTPGFREVLDYTLYSEQLLTPVASMAVPPLLEMESRQDWIPSEAHPSDHIPVYTDFNYTA